jgi:hypothetical protein
MNFKVYNQKIFCILLAVVGGLNLSMALIKTQRGSQIFFGSSMILLGILMLVNPALVIDEKNIYIRNPLGFTLKTYPYNLGEVRYEKSRIWVGDKKLSVIGWMLDKKSLQTFLDYLEKNKK